MALCVLRGVLEARCLRRVRVGVLVMGGRGCRVQVCMRVNLRSGMGADFFSDAGGFMYC